VQQEHSKQALLCAMATLQHQAQLQRGGQTASLYSPAFPRRSALSLALWPLANAVLRAGPCGTARGSAALRFFMRVVVHQRLASVLSCG